MGEKLKIVILGGGYAGLLTAITLQKKVHKKRASITLVNKYDYHYLTTKIHEAGAGTLDSKNIRFPITELIDTERVNFIQDEVIGINSLRKIVSLKNGLLSYDYLVAAIGGSPQTFYIPGLEENAFFLFDFEGTERLKNHIENEFSLYRHDHDEKRLSFVIGGAGFTGIEFLYEFTEHIPELCKKYDVQESQVKLICAEAADSLLNGYDSRMILDVRESLQHLLCEFRLGSGISSCSKDSVLFSDGSEIKANTIIWAGGVKGNSLFNDQGFKLLNGRVAVNQYLEVLDHKDIYVLGDASVSFTPEGEPIPPSAQIALQQGQYCGYHIASKVYGQIAKPFQYNHRGTVLSMGRKNATGIVYGCHIRGRFASFMKKVIELRYFYMLGGLSMLSKQIKVNVKNKK